MWPLCLFLDFAVETRKAGMTKAGLVVRYVLFCVFFAVGLGAVVLSILVDEIEDFYESRAATVEVEQVNETMEGLVLDVEAQIERAKNDPASLERLKRVMLGVEPSAEDTVFPKATDEGVALAAAVLERAKETADTKEAVPVWVARCMEQRYRWSLFVAGMGLVLITFLFFGSKVQADTEMEQNP